MESQHLSIDLNSSNKFQKNKEYSLTLKVHSKSNLLGISFVKYLTNLMDKILQVDINYKN